MEGSVRYQAKTRSHNRVESEVFLCCVTKEINRNIEREKERIRISKYQMEKNMVIDRGFGNENE